MRAVVARFGVVGSGGLAGTPPVFLAPDWPPTLAGPFAEARQFSTAEQAERARDAAQIHPLGREGKWIVYAVGRDGALNPTTSDN